MKLLFMLVPAISALLAPPNLGAQPSPLFEPDLNEGPRSLRGYVDLHTHPMSHLGMGGKLMHGAPDVDVLMPAGSIVGPRATCNKRARRARTRAEALGSCFGNHGRHSLRKNKCGNHLRRLVIDGFEKGNDTTRDTHKIDHPAGAPSFSNWPKHDDILHQQMWIDWVRRAHAGGMRVMVALANNSVTLSKGLSGNEPYDDKSAGDLQISEMKRMVGRHAFMEIVRSAANLRRVVGQDKLAIILGVELDDIGNFAREKRPPTAARVRAEIRRLHRSGVRYIFPLHVIDNHFGGSALYEHEFPRATRYHFGKWPKMMCAARGDNITKQLDHGADLFKLLGLGAAGGRIPTPRCPENIGFKNSRGLTDLGRVALDEMMSLGMIIDLDHASQRAANQILDHADAKPGRYPIVSGHNALRGSLQRNGVRDADGKRIPTDEKTRTAAQYRRIAAAGGSVGIDFDSGTARGFIADFNRVRRINPSLSINLGSDINGYVKLPGPPPVCTGGRAGGRALPRDPECVVYSRAKRIERLTTGRKTWDYNLEGVAHIGLVPDFLRHLENLPGGRRVVATLFEGAEGIARTWERAESVGRAIGVAGPSFTSVTARIRTGRDDVRRGARAWLKVRFRGGATSWVEVSSFAQKRNRTTSVAIPLGRTLRAADIVSISVKHFSNSCFACSRDYWEGGVRLEGAGRRIMETPSFRIGHQTKTFRRR